jgi:hypothetical protein
MSKQHIVSELVRKLGGPTVVAAEIGAQRSSVGAWSRLGRIPWKWRWLVRQMAMRGRISLTADDWAALSLVPSEEERLEAEAS